MVTKCPSSFACLTAGYLEVARLFINELPKYFNESECKLIMELLKRYMDDGLIFWPLNLNFENVKTFLNIIKYPSIKFTLEKPKIIVKNTGFKFL